MYPFKIYDAIALNGGHETVIQRGEVSRLLQTRSLTAQPKIFNLHYSACLFLLPFLWSGEVWALVSEEHLKDHIFNTDVAKVFLEQSTTWVITS